MTEQKFDKPLNEWTTEDVEVPIIQVKTDDDGKIVGVEKKTETRQVKTMYSEVKPQKFECAKGSHDWFMSDRHKHIASCRNCPKNRFLRAVYETIKNGKIVDRDSGIVID